MFLRKSGHGDQPAVSALTKLATLGNRHAFLSSHPAPEARAQRIWADSYDPHAVAEASLFERLWTWFKSFLPFGRGEETRG